MAVDHLTLLYSVLGGFFMGSYPVPIKTRAVLEVDPHPVVFQLYKSFWVFASSWIFVIARAINRGHFEFDFTWWAVASAAAWIPSGLGTIAAVPRLGVGMTIVVNAGLSSVLSFLVFWLVLGESMREYGPAGHRFSIAPFYLVCVVLGMAGLVAAPRAKCHRAQDSTDLQMTSAGVAAGAQAAAAQRAGASDTSASDAPLLPGDKQGAQVVGLLCALLSGVFSATQYAIVTLGKRREEDLDGCSGTPDACSEVLKERFNQFGSWIVSFGIGAMLVTMVYALLFAMVNIARQKPLPSMHFGVLLWPGSLAGILWMLGNVFQTAALERGGNAVMMASNQSIQLITSGAWGLLYYREVQDGFGAVCWVASALWTLAFMLMLSHEKAGS